MTPRLHLFLARLANTSLRFERTASNSANNPAQIPVNPHFPHGGLGQGDSPARRGRPTSVAPSIAFSGRRPSATRQEAHPVQASSAHHHQVRITDGRAGRGREGGRGGGWGRVRLTRARLAGSASFARCSVARVATRSLSDCDGPPEWLADSLAEPPILFQPLALSLVTSVTV